MSSEDCAGEFTVTLISRVFVKLELVFSKVLSELAGIIVLRVLVVLMVVLEVVEVVVVVVVSVIRNNKYVLHSISRNFSKN